MKVSEFWGSGSILKPRLRRSDWYVSDLKRMVELCRTTPGTFIPPSWMTQEQAQKVARAMNVPVANLRP